MPRKSFTAEQIVEKLRQVEILTGQGKALPQACKEAGFSDKSYYLWRKEFGGLKIEQANKFKKLQAENARLKKLAADLSLEKAMLNPFSAPYQRVAVIHADTDYPCNALHKGNGNTTQPHREACFLFAIVNQLVHNG